MATPDAPLRVLFLCTANSARSQIAEALLLKRGGEGFQGASAGTHPAEAVHPEAIAALAESGIDWSGRSPRGLAAVSQEKWDVIITTCDKSRESCPAFPGQPIYAHWSVPDPALAPPHLRRQAFIDTVQLLAWRIDLMLMVRLGKANHTEALRRTAAEQPEQSEVSED